MLKTMFSNPRFFLLAAFLVAAPVAFAQDVPVAVTSAEGDTLLAIHDDGSTSGRVNFFNGARRDQLYMVSSSQSVSGTSTAEATAYCESPADLPVIGECSTSLSATAHPELFVTVNWDNPTLHAGYRCRYQGDTGTTTFEARIFCLRAPASEQ